MSGSNHHSFSTPQQQQQQYLNAERRSTAATTQEPFGMSGRAESSRAGSVVYLVEVQYFLRLDTGQVLINYIFFNINLI
jgi:hypothetical protein